MDAILAELNPQYASSEKILNTRLNAIPGEIDAGIAQSDAKLGLANENILNSARRRGTGVAFGGIPLADQAKYAATEYAPAIANLRATGANKELGLQETLASLSREKRGQAQSIYDNEVARDFQERQFQESIRQFNEQQAAQARAAAQAASAAYSFGGGSSAPTANAPSGSAKIQQTANGFGFTDGTGRGINAAQYAQLTGRGYRDLLQQMANSGDNNAKIALKYVGNDGRFGNAPENVRGALSAVGAQGSFIPQSVANLSKPVTIKSGNVRLPSIFNG